MKVRARQLEHYKHDCLKDDGLVVIYTDRLLAEDLKKKAERQAIEASASRKRGR